MKDKTTPQTAVTNKPAKGPDMSRPVAKDSRDKTPSSAAKGDDQRMSKPATRA